MRPDTELPATPGVVRVAPEQVTDRIQQLLTDADARERLSITGRRHVRATADRRSALLAILDHLGVRRPAPLRTTVLLATRRPEHLDHALANVRAQRQPGVEVSPVLHGPAVDAVDVPDTGLATAQVLRAPGTWTLGDCLNAALDGAGGHLVTKMDDDDHYGPDHLTDLVLAWRYSGAEVVGERIEFIHLAERDLTLRRHPSPPERDRVHVGGPTLLAARDTLRRFGFLRRPNRVDSTLYDRVLTAGGRVYGTHARDVILSRHGDGHGHAWQVAELVEAVVAGGRHGEVEGVQVPGEGVDGHGPHVVRQGRLLLGDHGAGDQHLQVWLPAEAVQHPPQGRVGVADVARAKGDQRRRTRGIEPQRRPGRGAVQQLLALQVGDGADPGRLGAQCPRGAPVIVSGQLTGLDHQVEQVPLVGEHGVGDPAAPHRPARRRRARTRRRA